MDGIDRMDIIHKTEMTDKMYVIDGIDVKDWVDVIDKMDILAKIGKTNKMYIVDITDHNW